MSPGRDRSKDNQSFGRAVGGVCVLVSAYEIWRGRPTLAWVLGAVGVTLLALSWIAPRVLAVPARIWWRFAEVLGWVNLRIVLTVFFVVVMTPVGVLFRVFGRDPLARRATGSTWVPYRAGRRGTRHYERMF
jgi:hypothetical protein